MKRGKRRGRKGKKKYGERESRNEIPEEGRRERWGVEEREGGMDERKRGVQIRG